MSRKNEIIDFLHKDFPQFASIVEEVTDRSSVIRHAIGHDDLRPGGTVMGPTLFTVADSALYVAILGTIGIIPLAVTTNLNINFLRKPSAESDLIGKCKLLKVGAKLVVGEVYVYSEGDDEPVAHAVGTYSIPPIK